MAARYLVAGGTGNWNSTTNWSATSGGASGASFPTATDDVTIDANSANANITANVASACLSLTISNGHTGTLTLSNTLTVSGNVTLGSAMTIAGSGVLAVNANATLTSNGAVAGNLTFNGTTITITLADNWSVNNLTTSATGAGVAVTINGNTMTVGGNLNVFSAGNRILAGTTNLILGGTGTWSAGSNSELRLTTTITGTYTGTGTNTVCYGTGTLTLSGGSFNIGTLAIRSSCTLNLSGSTITTLSCVIASTITLSSNIAPTTITIASTTTFSGSAVFTTGTLSFSGGTIDTPRNLILASTQTYYVTSSINCSVGTSANRSLIKSSSGGSQANLVLTNPITQSNIYLDITDINSSAGATGFTIGGVLSNATNWNVLPTQPQTITSGYSS
jgi:hypothetical protein